MMTADQLKIEDIVSIDDDAQFRNDVQLSAYDDPVTNLTLLKSYLFSGTPPKSSAVVNNDVSPVQLLNHIIDEYMVSRPQLRHNRMVVIANYGHGKSHLALALANYFGRKPESEEVQRLLAKVRNASGETGISQRIQQFKQNRGTFLVIRLRGDHPISLREQFLRALDSAIDEHPETQGKRPNFWYTEAERILSNFTPTEREQADAYLSRDHTMDTELLLRKLRERKEVYDLTIDTIAHVKGIIPNLNGQISLKQVMD